MSYAETINAVLKKKYPHPQQQQQVVTSYLNFKFFNEISMKEFQKYSKMKVLVIKHCDLRNLQHFPRLKHLTDLDLSHNNLQGTFNNLMKLSRLNYLNISNNIIMDVAKLMPLKKLGGISICVTENPFVMNCVSWRAKVKGFNLKVIRDPKKLVNDQQEQHKQEVEEDYGEDIVQLKKKLQKLASIKKNYSKVLDLEKEPQVPQLSSRQTGIMAPLRFRTSFTSQVRQNEENNIASRATQNNQSSIQNFMNNQPMKLSFSSDSESSPLEQMKPLKREPRKYYMKRQKESNDKNIEKKSQSDVSFLNTVKFIQNDNLIEVREPQLENQMIEYPLQQNLEIGFPNIEDIIDNDFDKISSESQEDPQL